MEGGEAHSWSSEAPQPMEASGMKAPTPDRHCTSTQPSLHTLLPHLWHHKALTSLLLSWDPAPASSLYTDGAGSPTGGLLLSSTSMEGEGGCCSHPHRLWAIPSLCTVTSRSHGVSEMSLPVIMPTLLYASVEGAARELWGTGGGG